MSKEVYANRIILEVENIKRVLNRVLEHDLKVNDDAVRKCLADKSPQEVQNGSVQMVNHTNTLVATFEAVKQIIG